MTTTIYFDMDGTIADLYNYNDWLEMLQNENIEPYANCSPIEIDEVREVLNSLVGLGWTIGVISWSARNGSKEYNRATRKAKKQWINTYLPGIVSEFHVVKYGTPKHYVCKVKDSILVDDNADVRARWHGQTIDATDSKKMLENLKKLLDTAVAA